MLRFPDEASLAVQTVPAKASPSNQYKNKFRVKAVYEVIPNQDWYFFFGKQINLLNHLIWDQYKIIVLFIKERTMYVTKASQNNFLAWCKLIM